MKTGGKFTVLLKFRLDDLIKFIYELIIIFKLEKKIQEIRSI
jgi:hypothetical protein